MRDLLLLILSPVVARLEPGQDGGHNVSLYPAHCSVHIAQNWRRKTTATNWEGTMLNAVRDVHFFTEAELTAAKINAQQ